jgi:hypothetical protein
MASFLIIVFLATITWLLWMTYQTLDGFNEDLKQLRVLVGHIERRMSGDPTMPSYHDCNAEQPSTDNS